MRPEQYHLKLVKKREIKYVCQYTRMTDTGRELNRIETFYQIVLRVYPAIKRRIRRWYHKFAEKGRRRSNIEKIINGCRPEAGSRDELKIGDIVKVLSYSEIKSTLNEKGYFRGLSFQESMEKWCGNTYQVLKIPEYVLDQAGAKINKCKDVVILRGLYCNGKGTVLEEGCDRCCLHYWKTDWVKKVV